MVRVGLHGFILRTGELHNSNAKLNPGLTSRFDSIQPNSSAAQTSFEKTQDSRGHL